MPNNDAITVTPMKLQALKTVSPSGVGFANADVDSWRTRARKRQNQTPSKSRSHKMKNSAPFMERDTNTGKESRRHSQPDIWMKTKLDNSEKGLPPRNNLRRNSVGHAAHTTPRHHDARKPGSSSRRNSVDNVLLRARSSNSTTQRKSDSLSATLRKSGSNSRKNLIKSRRGSVVEDVLAQHDTLVRSTTPHRFGKSSRRNSRSQSSDPTLPAADSDVRRRRSSQGEQDDREEKKSRRTRTGTRSNSSSRRGSLSSTSQAYPRWDLPRINALELFNVPVDFTITPATCNSRRRVSVSREVMSHVSLVSQPSSTVIGHISCQNSGQVIGHISRQNSGQFTMSHISRDDSLSHLSHLTERKNSWNSMCNSVHNKNGHITPSSSSLDLSHHVSSVRITKNDERTNRILHIPVAIFKKGSQAMNVEIFGLYKNENGVMSPNALMTFSADIIERVLKMLADGAIVGDPSLELRPEKLQRIVEKEAYYYLPGIGVGDTSDPSKMLAEMGHWMEDICYSNTRKHPWITGANNVQSDGSVSFLMFVQLLSKVSKQMFRPYVAPTVSHGKLCNPCCIL